MKHLINDYRMKYGQYISDKRQRAPVICLSEESSSTSIIICDAIMQKSDTALVILPTRRQQILVPKRSHSFCSNSHRDLPKFCYPDSVLTVAPRHQCSNCGRELHAARAENVACQAPEEQGCPPSRAFKAIQVNLCPLEKYSSVNIRTSSWTQQCVACGGSVKGHVPADFSTKERYYHESNKHGIPIYKGNLCPCFTGLEQKRDQCLPSITEKLQDPETVSNIIEICMPLTKQQNSFSWPKARVLQSLDSNKDCCHCFESGTRNLIINSHKNKKHVAKYHVSIEEQDVSHKYQTQRARRRIKSHMFVNAEDRVQQNILVPQTNTHRSSDTYKGRPEHDLMVQCPFLERECVRAKQKNRNRDMLPSRGRKTIQRSICHATPPTAIFHLNITKASQVSQKNTTTAKQYFMKQRSSKSRSARHVRGCPWGNDSSAVEICRQTFPAVHHTSPQTKVTLNSSTKEQKKLLVSHIDSAPCTSGLPLWKNIVQFLKKTFLPNFADSLTALYSHESQVDTPELLCLLGNKENKLKCVEPGLRRSFSDSNKKKLLKLNSKVKGACHNEQNLSCKSSAPTDVRRRLYKQDFPVSKQSMKFLKYKSTLLTNSEHIQVSSSTNHRQTYLKHVADNDCVITPETRSKMNSRSVSCGKCSKRNTFVVPNNRPTGEKQKCACSKKQKCACSKDTKEKPSTKILWSTPRSRSVIMSTRISQMSSGALPRDPTIRPSVFRNWSSQQFTSKQEPC